MHKRRRYNNSYLNKRNISHIMEKRFNILFIIIIILFSLLAVKLITLQIGSKDIYQKKLAAATSRTILSDSVPRGRIYDRNYKLLVDNKGRKVIYYKKVTGTTKKEEVTLAYEVSKILDLPYQKLHITNLKEFWLVNHPKEGYDKITDKEYQQLKMHKMTSSDIQRLKIERITEKDLSVYNDNDKKAAYVYFLMNNGYSYDEKIIKDNNVTASEYAVIAENVNHYKGFNTKIEWERVYPYGDTLREILGAVTSGKQGIPFDKKDDYLNKGYALNDRVGISYLEYQYENLLKGEKSVYKINNDNSYELVKRGNRGHDLVLSIDIDLQVALENIVVEEMIKTKKEPNTEYFNKAYVVISNPYTGAILAYVAKQISFQDGAYKVYDYTPYIATTTITVGSVIKGASITVGYNTGAISIGTKMLDECIKIQHTPPKCSWTSGLGVLNDQTAIVYSSNVYQFKTAMKVAGAKYSYNKPLVVDKSAFKKYRDTFAEYGLGSKTDIDLPLEISGYKGGDTVAGHLLDFAIGQYDTYTPIQLVQYINAIANNGSRYKLNLLKEVHKPTMTDQIGALSEIIEPTILNKITTDPKYLDRIRSSFNAVMKGPLGRNYMGRVPNPAGKTGTAQSFIDRDNNGKIDTETLTKTFAGYFPADKPVMSIVVISPDASHPNGRSGYVSSVNKRIASRASEKFLELYK